MSTTSKLCNYLTLNNDWEEKIEDELNILYKRSGDLIIFKYNQLKADFTNPIVCEARGMIVRENKHKIDINGSTLINATYDPVCWTFNKFHTLENLKADSPLLQNIDWESARIEQKADGSIIKVWYDKFKFQWRISTNFSIDAADAPLSMMKQTIYDYDIRNFEEYFKYALQHHYRVNKSTCSSWEDLVFILNRDGNINYTYIFELCGPINRVITEYENIHIYFIGCRNNVTGEEFNPYHMSIALPCLHFRTPVKSFNEVKSWLDKFMINQFPDTEFGNIFEGFVLVDDKFNRVKIKNPYWQILHKISDKESNMRMSIEFTKLLIKRDLNSRYSTPIIFSNIFDDKDINGHILFRYTADYLEYMMGLRKLIRTIQWMVIDKTDKLMEENNGNPIIPEKKMYIDIIKFITEDKKYKSIGIRFLEDFIKHQSMDIPELFYILRDYCYPRNKNEKDIESCIDNLAKIIRKNYQ